MKKLFSVILSIIFLLSGMINLAFAQEPENEKTNIAPLGTAYSSSEKNSLWTPAKTINDGVYGFETWEGWECAYPNVSKGQDTSGGFANEYCGINFDAKFYEISEIKINLGLHTLLGGQNAHYEIVALVEGKWQVIATFMDSDAIPYDEKYSSYNDVMTDEGASQRVLADYAITLNKPVFTNNIRINISSFGKNYEGGDVKVFPYIYEMELYGREATAPEIILPEGATATANIAWYSYPQASSSQENHYPFLAIDEDKDTYWAPNENDNEPTYTLVLDREYTINKIALKLNNESNVNNISVGIMVNGNWQELNIQPNKNLEYFFTPINVTEIRLAFSNEENIQLVALEAHLSESRTYYFDSRFSWNQIVSASGGNIAIIGKPYASTSLTPYSDVNFINDGLENKQWFTGTIDVPEYCGLSFDFPQKISKATITVKTPIKAGTEVMSFEIQALINGEFVKLVDGRTYNEEEGYTTAYTFDEIETKDIRVVFTDIDGAIPNVGELRLYNNDNTPIPMLMGIEDFSKNEGMNCIMPDINEVIGDHSCEKNSNGKIVPIIISVSLAVAVISVAIALVLRKKRNKGV